MMYRSLNRYDVSERNGQVVYREEIPSGRNIEFLEELPSRLL